jgi:lipoprotein-anchoring transpeptidase ErfK/SrfK
MNCWSVQQLESLARDVGVVRRRVEQLAAKQEQMAHNIASLQAVEQDIRQKMSSPPLSPAVPRPPRKNAPTAAPPQPPARGSILADWSIRDAGDAGDGYVSVQGHGDVYQVVLGAPLPGLGPVEQIKRQDGRWVVVTPKGIIVSRRDRRYFQQHTAP